MISTDFAGNETWDDAVLSLKLLFQPWRWKDGNEINQVKSRLLKIFESVRPDLGIDLFLTGRSALYFLLKSLGLPKGSPVLVQAFTCEAVVLPIIELGLKPVYVDIEKETFAMDFASLTRKLANPQTSKCKVLILQHTFGLTPADRIKILELAQKNKLIIVEDLAHGFNPEIFKNPSPLPLTTSYYLLSFGRSKMISSVFGGAIISSNSLTRKRVNPLTYPSDWFILRCLLYKPLTMLIKSTYDIYLGKMLHKLFNSLNLLIPEVNNQEKKGTYDHVYDKYYPNALAILLLMQLDRLEETNALRKRTSDLYEKSLSGKKPPTLNSAKALIRYPLLIEERDRLWQQAIRSNIFLGRWYDQVVAPRDLNLGRVGYKSGSCPVAEKICQKIINLPTNISEKEAKDVIRVLNDVM